MSRFLSSYYSNINSNRYLISLLSVTRIKRRSMFLPSHYCRISFYAPSPYKQQFLSHGCPQLPLATFLQPEWNKIFKRVHNRNMEKKQTDHMPQIYFASLFIVFPLSFQCFQISVNNSTQSLSKRPLHRDEICLLLIEKADNIKL